MADPVLLARAGTRRFAFRAQDVAAVLPLPRLTCPPGATPRPLVGFADIGGRTTPVLAPEVLLGDDRATMLGIDTHLLVLRTADPLALAVDRVTEILWDADVRPQAARDSVNGWLAGELGEGEETHALVRIDRLLLDAERARLRAIGELAERREAEA